MEKKFLTGSKISNPKQTIGSNAGGSTIQGSTMGDKKASTNKQAQQQQQKNDRNAEREKSSEERLAEIEIYPIERVHLDRVFELMSTAAPNKSKEDKGEQITADDIAKILLDLKFKMSRADIDLMIWVQRLFHS